MNIIFSWNIILKASAIIGAVTVITTFFVKMVHWVDHQKKQDVIINALRDRHESDILEIKKEQTLLTYGILACLKGLKDQGCNGAVTDAIHKIEKHLNQKAHE